MALVVVFSRASRSSASGSETGNNDTPPPPHAVRSTSKPIARFLMNVIRAKRVPFGNGTKPLVQRAPWIDSEPDRSVSRGTSLVPHLTLPIENSDSLALLLEVRRARWCSAKRISSLIVVRRAENDLPSFEHAGRQAG